MADSSLDVLEVVGDFDELPSSFYVALARLLLAAHEAEKAKSMMEPDAKGVAR